MSRRIVPALVRALGGCTGSSGDFRNRPLAANPSAFIAAEIRFAQLAQAEGQWTAFRETAHPDAVMFVPERAKAQDWLKSQKDPAEAVKWQPHAVYVSRDRKRVAGGRSVYSGVESRGAR